jgi:N-sulfoglucosamine sulfohydrolase
MKRLLSLLLSFAPFIAHAADRPNIVWIVGEDMGPELGCYGDRNAITPNMDRLAREGTRFAKAFTHCAVCAPSRSGLITGRYPISIGTQHMRSKLINPPVTFTKRLQDAGYHVAWPGKTDFNFDEPKDFATVRKPWHKGPNAAKLPEPFFAYANFTQSHESQVRNDGNKYAANTARLKPEQRRDPAKMVLPSFWPDAPIVREELARYYDLVTSVDYDVGEVLDYLDRNGLAENTVVFMFGDHGRGMARHKRWVYDSGTHVPLIVRWPGKVKAGAVREDLVEFLDLPATALALGTGKVPADLEGRAMLTPDGAAPAEPRKYVHAHRDYMDEVLDRIRSVRDGRFRYIKNFMPELPYAQRIAYMEIGKTMRTWREWHAAGKLNPVQSLFFAERKPAEELYDCEADPDEVKNLANDPKYAEKLAELRTELDRWLKSTNDMAGRMTAEEMVEKGIIKPRAETYEARKKTGTIPAK